jgi:PKD repeat protein
MTSTLRASLPRLVPAIGLVAMLTTGCAVQEQPAPSLAGPSELGLGLSVTALPETLPRDGSSMATIIVAAFDSNGAPLKSQRFILTASAGTLNPAEVLTGNDGKVSVVYIAPGVNERVTTVTIVATPVGVLSGDNANVNARTVRIDVLGPAIPFASFNFNPATPAVLDAVTFDATTTGLNGAQCQADCTYSWDFGDGSTGTGQVLQHSFSTSGVFHVKLTATAVALGTANSITRAVVVSPPAAPVANFTTGPCAPVAAQCIRFTDASTVGLGATITSYLIDFGDNTNATSMPVQRQYAAAGTYNVRLTVTDSLGRTATVTRPVVVP